MKLRWMPQALRDLHAIRTYISRDNPVAARRWINKLQARAETASTLPLAGRVVPEVERVDVREVFVGSYRIVYRGQVHVRKNERASSRESSSCQVVMTTGRQRHSDRDRARPRR